MNNLLKREHWIKRCLPPLVLIVLLPAIAVAQGGMSGAEETALAGSVAARAESPWFAGRNPALLSGAASPSLLASYSPSSIGIEGYHEGALAASMPVDSLRWIGAIVEGVGVRGYSEMIACAVAAARLRGGIAVGGALSLHSLAIDRYGAALAASIGIGALARLTEEIRFGASVANIASTRIGGTDLPQRLMLGFAFDLAHGTTLSLDVAHELRRRASVALAISTVEAHGLMLRAGVGSEPARFALGASCEVDRLRLDYGASYTLPLGMRHAIGIGVLW